MDINDTSCCALMEIELLSDHKDPVEAMKAFCRHHWNPYSKSMFDPGAFMYFTGVSRVTDKSSDCDCTSRDPEKCEEGYGFCECECHTPTKYGERFASLIKTAKLGPIKATRAVPNRSNHPNHLVRVWVWAPDLEALRKWYELNK